MHTNRLAGIKTMNLIDRNVAYMYANRHIEAEGKVIKTETRP